MLRTSLRTKGSVSWQCRMVRFLSSNAQDFIEESVYAAGNSTEARFLSSNAQDFIEELHIMVGHLNGTDNS